MQKSERYIFINRPKYLGGRILDFFNLKLHNTSVKTEVVSGISTFLAISYILFLNPVILSKCGMDFEGVFIATILSTACTTLIGAIYCKLPLVFAPGLGMNTYFVLVAMREFQGSWSVALLATYFSGVLLLVIVLTGMYDCINEMIPDNMKRAIMIGIGLAIIKMGIVSSGLVTIDDAYRISFESLCSKETLSCIVSLVIFIIIYKKHNKKLLCFGLVLTFLIGALFEIVSLVWIYGFDFSGLYHYFFSSQISLFSFTKVAFQFPTIRDITYIPNYFFRFITVVFVMTLSHLFDAIGSTGFVVWNVKKEDPNFEQGSIKKSILVNGIGSVLSGCLGTSSVTTFAESSIGAVSGGKTGLSAIVTTVCLGIMLICSPIFVSVSIFIMSPCLIVVGVILVKSMTKFDEISVKDGIVVLYIIITIALTFNITDGVLNGMLLHYLINLVTGSKRTWNPYSLLIIIPGIINLISR